MKAVAKDAEATPTGRRRGGKKTKVAEAVAAITPRVLRSRKTAKEDKK